MTDLDLARREVSQSSAGGAAFLICFGASLLVCAVLWFFLPVEQAALAVMFQGVVVSAGALALQMTLGRRAFPFILMLMTASYWVGAVLVRRAAWRLTH